MLYVRAFRQYELIGNADNARVSAHGVDLVSLTDPTLLKFGSTACLCGECVIPLLSNQQKKSHLEFAKHFRNNFFFKKESVSSFTATRNGCWVWQSRRAPGLPRSWLLTSRLFKRTTRVQFNKTMAVAFAGFAFEDNIEKSGKAFKLGFF
jgi:hypothetical protein